MTVNLVRLARVHLLQLGSTRGCAGGARSWLAKREPPTRSQPSCSVAAGVKGGRRPSRSDAPRPFEQYNSDRPHQGLDEKVPVVPADRFEPAASNDVELWVPPALSIAAATAAPEPVVDREPDREPGDPVEVDKVVPASGNMTVCRNQFWLGPARVGQVVRFWVDCEWVHLSIGGQRVKSLRSRFSVNDLALLAAQGAVPAGPAPLPSRGRPGSRAGRKIVEVERTVAKAGTVSLGSRVVLAAEILAGRRVGIYIEDGAPLLFFDPQTRELLQTRPNPLEPGEAVLLQRQRPVGEVPRPSTEPIRVQRRASNTGLIMVAGQQVALGRGFTGQTVTVLVSETTLAVELDDGDVRIFRRTTTDPVRSIKGQRPRTAGT